MGTSEEWDNWTTAAQMKHNFRYWLAEEGLSYLQDFVTWPVRKIYDVKYYINNRWVTRTHALTAHPRDIKPGAWCDVGNRFLPCLFNELVDFVETESAWSHIAWGSKEDRASSCHAYLMSWLISSKLNPHGRTSLGEVKKIVLSMILPFGLLVGGVGALGVALKQVSIILTGQ
jgi:hypothetical protein